VKAVIIKAAAALGLAGLTALHGASLTNLTSFKPFVGLDYSPFQGTETPMNGNYPQYYPTLDQITNDFTSSTNSLVSLASEITTYGMDGTLSNIAGICNTYGVKCYPCAYVSSGSSADATDTAYEISALIAVGNQNYPTTRGLVVGSESILQGYSPETLISNINYVRAATGTNVPVGTRDIPSSFTEYPGIVAASDFIMTDIYAFWSAGGDYEGESITITNAAAWTIQQWQTLTNAFPGKPILMGEAGWPTGGMTGYSYGGVPGMSSQAKFLSDFVGMANSNHIEYFIFEYRDELWKVNENTTIGTVEQNWGLLDTNSSKKQSLVDYLSTNFSMKVLSAKTNHTQIAVQTYEGNPYSLLGTTNFLENFNNLNTNFTGAPSTNQTAISVTNSGKQQFFKAMQDF
jgi:exo-beta-1,3-glucanase (GH17 family)